MSARPRLLIVDDRPNMLRLADKILRGEGEVLTANTGAEAIAILEREPIALIVCDLKMGDVDGLEVLAEARRLRPAAPFVLMTAYASIPTAIEAMRLGAYDYLSKPFEPDDLRAIVLRALGRASAGEPSSDHELLPRTYGQSPAMVKLADLVRRIAPTDAPALILGETGTGKERVAHALHELSQRARGPFVVVNCAALPAETLELELFGRREGLQGAPGQVGLFERAVGGSLFLDEIGDMKASLQAKLTRVLEERRIRRVGDSEEIDVDVRIIAATHRDIPRMIADGTFRQDLWYRLNVAQLELPPLRERPEDIAILAHRILADESDKRPGGPRALAPSALQLLEACAWPGNVRQLRAAVQRAAIVAAGPNIELADLPPELLDEVGPIHADAALTWHEAMDRARERAGSAYLRMTLAAEAGNVAAAARRAGVERESFYRLLRRHGVRPDDYRHKQ